MIFIQWTAPLSPLINQVAMDGEVTNLGGAHLKPNLNPTYQTRGVILGVG